MLVLYGFASYQLAPLNEQLKEQEIVTVRLVEWVEIVMPRQIAFYS
jgi:hypothetical protein